MELQKRIEHYLRRTKTTATELGRLALNDGHFVFDLRKGRKVGQATAARVHAWLDDRGPGR